MKGLLITAAIIAFILLFKFKITIAYADDLTLTVTLLGIPIRILPAKEKKVRVWRYSLRRMRKKDAKRRQALAKKAKSDREKAAQKKQRKAEQKKAQKGQPKAPPGGIIHMVLELVKVIFSRFGRHLRIEMTRLRLVVATGDAAQTAILWGVICPAVEALLEVLDRITNLRTVKSCDIDVIPDFAADSFKADISIAFSLRVWHLFDIAFRALFSFIKHKPNVPAAPAAQKPAPAKPDTVDPKPGA